MRSSSILAVSEKFRKVKAVRGVQEWMCGERGTEAVSGGSDAISIYLIASAIPLTISLPLKDNTDYECFASA